jgi:hypothetical protein
MKKIVAPLTRLLSGGDTRRGLVVAAISQRGKYVEFRAGRCSITFVTGRRHESFYRYIGRSVGSVSLTLAGEHGAKSAPVQVGDDSLMLDDRSGRSWIESEPAHMAVSFERSRQPPASPDGSVF